MTERIIGAAITGDPAGLPHPGRPRRLTTDGAVRLNRARTCILGALFPGVTFIAPLELGRVATRPEHLVTPLEDSVLEAIEDGLEAAMWSEWWEEEPE
jgi:hypothetical protein